MPTVPTDADLVVQAQDGSPQAFDALVDRYWRGAVSMAYRRTRTWSDAEDAAQDAFVLAFRKLGQLREPAKFPGWFFTIVARSCVEMARRKPRRPVSVEDPEVMADPLLEGKARRADQGAVREQIQAAIEALPERYRPVVLLRYGQGMQVNDISEALGVPRGTVVSQMFRANRILRAKLGHLVSER